MLYVCAGVQNQILWSISTQFIRLSTAQIHFWHLCTYKYRSGKHCKVLASYPRMKIEVGIWSLRHVRDSSNAIMYTAGFGFDVHIRKQPRAHVLRKHNKRILTRKCNWHRTKIINANEGHNQNLSKAPQKETTQVRKQQRFSIWYVHEKIYTCTHVTHNIGRRRRRGINKDVQLATNPRQRVH